MQSGNPDWSNNTGNTWWHSLIGPVVASIVVPMLKYGLHALTDWYVRRVTTRLYRTGILRDRRQSRPTQTTSRFHKGED